MKVTIGQTVEFTSTEPRYGAVKGERRTVLAVRGGDYEGTEIKISGDNGWWAPSLWFKVIPESDFFTQTNAYTPPPCATTQATAPLKKGNTVEFVGLARMGGDPREDGARHGIVRDVCGDEEFFVGFQSNDLGRERIWIFPRSSLRGPVAPPATGQVVTCSTVSGAPGAVSDPGIIAPVTPCKSHKARVLVAGDRVRQRHGSDGTRGTVEAIVSNGVRVLWDGLPPSVLHGRNELLYISPGPAATLAQTVDPKSAKIVDVTSKVIAELVKPTGTRYVSVNNVAGKFNAGQPVWFASEVHDHPWKPFRKDDVIYELPDLPVDETGTVLTAERLMSFGYDFYCNPEKTAWESAWWKIGEGHVFQSGYRTSHHDAIRAAADHYLANLKGTK